MTDQSIVQFAIADKNESRVIFEKLLKFIFHSIVFHCRVGDVMESRGFTLSRLFDSFIIAWFMINAILLGLEPRRVMSKST
ncbi:MAG: hypothetical protein F4X92_04805 [Gammaproteobacteria bacterium]|nr:hypothetical protein [Gammaproteobacteria bacterium]